MNRRAPIFAAIAVVLVAILVFFFLVRPKLAEVGVARQTLDDARAEETVLRVELTRLQQVERDAPEISRRLTVLRRKVPPVADLPGIINQMQTAADRSGVDFFSISPGDPVPAPGVTAAEIPVTIQVNGGFFQVDEFLFRVETLRRAAKVISLNVSEGPDGFPQLTASMNVVLYTTDVDAGPGAPVAEPSPVPTPEASPSPGETPADETEGA